MAQIEINKTIEESISRFFLFDGEMLSEYEELIEGTGGDLSEAIKKSIEDILRITLLKQEETRLNNFGTVQYKSSIKMMQIVKNLKKEHIARGVEGRI